MRQVIFLLALITFSTTLALKTSLSKKNLQEASTQITIQPDANDNVPGSNTNDPTYEEEGHENDVVMAKRPDGKVYYTTTAYCYINDKGTIYDLNGLNSSNIDYRIDNLNGTLNFNFCQNTNNHCKYDNKGLAFFTDSVSGSCYKVAGEASFSSKVGILKNNVINENGKNQVQTTIILSTPVGEVCRSDKTKNYSISYYIECDESAEKPKILSNYFNPADCHNEIKLKAKAACPVFDSYGVYRTIINNKFFFGFFLIFTGIFYFASSELNSLKILR